MSAYVLVTLYFVDGSRIGGPLLMAFTFDGSGKVVLREEYVNEAIFPSEYKDLATRTGSSS